MVPFENLVFTHRTAYGKVALYGAQLGMKHHPSSIHDALTTATRDGAQPNKVCILKPASDAQMTGFQLVAPATFWSDTGQRQVSDGAVLTEIGSAVGLQVGDCPGVVLLHPKRAVVTHAGRAALGSLSGCTGCCSNVVSQAFSYFSKSERSDVTAVIMASIAPQHFGHPDEKGQELMRPFRDLYGEQVFFGDSHLGQFDMVKLIKSQCIGYGVRAENIVWDTLDSYSHPDLASHRQQVQKGVPPKQQLRNTIFVHFG